MQKRFNLLKKQHQRTNLIIGVVFLFITVVMIFIGLELKHNQERYISNFNTEQQALTDQVALRMKAYIETMGLTTEEATDKIISEIETTGSKFWFIAQAEELLFVKNNNTLKMIPVETLSSFIQDNVNNKVQVTYNNFTVNDVQYTIGTCTMLEYIVDEGQLIRHIIFIFMPLIVLCLAIPVIIIRGLLTINKQEDIIEKLTVEAIERNITIEELTNRMKKTKQSDIGKVRDINSEPKDQIIYKKEVLVSLLEKINREKVAPLSIIIIELSSKNMNFKQENYQEFIKSSSKYLSKEHVFAEVSPGVFTILMFHTLEEATEEIKQILINEWAAPLKQKGINVRMGFTNIKDSIANAETVFEIVYREIASNI